VYTGIFFGASMDAQEPAYLLKMVQHVRSGERSEVNGVREILEGYAGVGEDHSMSFETKDVIHLSVEGVVINMQDKRPNGKCFPSLFANADVSGLGPSSGFRTDTDISGNVARRDRDLQRWTPSGSTDVDLTLENSGSTGAWDQFQANEKLFGLKSDYDENLYTTRIDRSAPQFRQREAEAERIAREIETGNTSNTQLRGDRGLEDEDGDYDEEEK